MKEKSTSEDDPPDLVNLNVFNYSSPPKPLETKLIASPKDFRPSRSDFNVIGAFNPGVTTVSTPEGDLETILFVRVAETPSIEIEGKILLPYFRIENKEGAQLSLDYEVLDNSEIKVIDEKTVRIKKTGRNRLRHISLPRRMILRENQEPIIERAPAINPAWDFDKYGMEDFRITYFEDGRFFITYVTPDEINGVNSQILTTNEIKKTEFKRITRDNTPHFDVAGKDVVIFPEKIHCLSTTSNIRKGDKIYAAFTRLNAFPDICVPGINLSYSPDLVFWGLTHRLLPSQNKEVTGAGSPPMRRPYGWLAPYHETTRNEKKETKYVTRLLVLDLKNPWKVKNVSPVLLERKDFREILPEDGFVPNTVFTTGFVINKDGTASLYHGVDDQWTAETRYDIKDLDKFSMFKVYTLGTHQKH
jgi:beta-1,2-mannobiose phosphorylase / 1,2-beta-oligomannan phosphorylase